jgi:hypothetical protein
MITADARQPEPAGQSVPGEAPARLDPRVPVTIARTDPADAQQRQILVRIDRGPTATLLFGDRIHVDVSPGPHVLSVNNTLFWKRLAFDAQPGEPLQFAVINRSGRFALGFLTIMGVAPLFLSVERRPVA